MKRLSSAVLAGVVAFTLGSTTALGQEDKKVARLWKAKCGSCHGATGAGDTDKGKEMKLKDLSDPKWQASKKDEEVKQIILDVKTVDVGGKKEEVHGYKESLSAAQVDSLVAFLRGFKR